MNEDPEAVATDEEVRAALESLTVADHLRLKKFARLRVRGLGLKASGRNYEDLLNEAFLAVLEGRRKWKPGSVTMVDLLAGIVRSISSHWAEQFDPETALLESELSTDPGRPSPLARAPSARPDQERELAAKQDLEELQDFFKDDDTVVLIIEGFRDGMAGPEICAALGMTRQEYEAGRKRMIRYRGKSKAEGRGDNA